ncbi:hypothetical protein BK121_28910 [Paenibacillus odorifer]|nr:hypothetical protein BK121_28910 [Paenibacillus odorifer]OMC74058.1 hypothetical protein BK125_22050 [Paenibacillus odorifer]OZQ74847.1 hypothetical protein CA596_15315 [Paenibacillus odorifer]
MNEGDSEANFAYYALHELHILPHELMKLSSRERAAIYAMIAVRVEKEKRDQARSKARKR